VDELKKLVGLLPKIATKPTRKAEVIGVLERFLMGGGAVQLWGQLDKLQQSAVAEAVHSDEGDKLARRRNSLMAVIFRLKGVCVV